MVQTVVLVVVVVRTLQGSQHNRRWAAAGCRPGGSVQTAIATRSVAAHSRPTKGENSDRISAGALVPALPAAAQRDSPVKLPPSPPAVGFGCNESVGWPMLAQRCCKLCGETFDSSVRVAGSAFTASPASRMVSRLSRCVVGTSCGAGIRHECSDRSPGTSQIPWLCACCLSRVRPTGWHGRQPTCKATGLCGAFNRPW
jgi:hypothetical protein